HLATTNTSTLSLHDALPISKIRKNKPPLRQQRRTDMGETHPPRFQYRIGTVWSHIRRRLPNGQKYHRKTGTPDVIRQPVPGWRTPQWKWWRWLVAYPRIPSRQQDRQRKNLFATVCYFTHYTAARMENGCTE